MESIVRVKIDSQGDGETRSTRSSSIVCSSPLTDSVAYLIVSFQSLLLARNHASSIRMYHLGPFCSTTQNLILRLSANHSALLTVSLVIDHAAVNDGTGYQFWRTRS